MVSLAKIGEQAWEWAAEALDCEVAAVKAFAAVESNGGGFLPDGQPKILFEAHIFSQLTGGRYDKDYPRISSPMWNKRLYVGGKAEHFRLQKACELNRTAGLQSASWGMFQILGRNWAACGYDSLQEFINDMYKDEEGHLRAFVGFVQHEGLHKALQTKNWKLLARKYNGPRFFENRYDSKLEEAYKRFLNA